VTVPVLECHDIVKRFALPSRRGGWRGRKYFNALDGVTLMLEEGETLGLVGESGSGKSTVAKVLGMLLAQDSGEVRFRGDRLPRPGLMAALPSQRLLRPFRRRVQMVFQDPFTSLNPRLTVGRILDEPLAIHRGSPEWRDRTTRARRVQGIAEQVGIGRALLERYPHELSGGQRQRVAIGRALSLEPDVVIADEPLSALDVSVQSQILNLLQDLREVRQIAYLFISHDLAAVEHLADRIAVMYFGRIVETAPRDRLFAAPRHPYTRTLLDAVPRLPADALDSPAPLPSGEIPSAVEDQPGCAFAPRCRHAADRCLTERPVLAPGDDANHIAACHFPLAS